MSCLFCKIAAGEIPAKKVYENDKVLAFDDINPQAPVHVLVIPREHIESVNGLTRGNSAVMADIFMAVQEIVKIRGIAEKGYRVLINNGKAAHQEVPHLHFHIFGGVESLGSMIKKLV